MTTQLRPSVHGGVVRLPGYRNVCRLRGSMADQLIVGWAARPGATSSDRTYGCQAWLVDVPRITNTPSAATKTLPKPKKHHAKKPGAAPATLIVTATTPTYVKLRLGSPSGKQVFAGTLETGQSHRWYAKRFWIAASDPAGVRLTVNGHVRRLPPATKRVGVVVTASGLKASSGA